MDHSDTSPCEVLKVVDDPSISKRRGGCDVVVGDKLYLWGGTLGLGGGGGGGGGIAASLV